MNNVKTLQRQLLLELSHKLDKYGFRYLPGTQQFRREIPGGKQIIHITFIPYKHNKHEFGVAVDVAVRHDAIENIVHAENTRITAEEKDQTASIGVELGNYSTGRWQQWQVTNKEDIVGVVNNVAAQVEAVGLPYLERFSSLEEVLSVLSRDDETGWLHSPVHYVRAQIAITAAFLLGQRSVFEQLVKNKTEFLRQREEFGLDEFIHLAEVLREKWLDPR